MSTIQIGTSAAVDSALRKGFSQASVRVAPETRMTDIIASLELLGIAVTLTDGILVLAQGSTMMNTSLALRNFALRPENANFFILTTSDPKTWTMAQKVAYLSNHTPDDYAKLCSGQVLEAGIKVLDANLSRRDYANLTRAEKVQFISEYGITGVERVMGKSK